jgi:predicted transcriptional regulator
MDMRGEELLNQSRRERQIMRIVYQMGTATANEITERMPDPPSHSAVRAMIRILESKGHLTHRKDGVRHVYRSTRSAKTVRRSALKRMLETFFGGSVEQAVSALISSSDRGLSDEELNRLETLIHSKRKGGAK